MSDPASTPLPPQSLPEWMRVPMTVITDPWVLFDPEDRVIEYNAAFRGLVPRDVARRLKTMTAAELIRMPGSGEQELRRRCAESGHLRLDELDITVAGVELRVILSAVIVPLETGTAVLCTLRNVTDEARVQESYRQLVEESDARLRAGEEALAARTRELLAANTKLNELEQELGRLRRGET